MIPFHNIVANSFPFPVLKQCGVLLFGVLVLSSCGTQSDESPKVDEPDWKGTPEEFLQAFEVQEGRFKQRNAAQLFTGKLHFTQSPPHPAYSVKILEGIPVQWQESSSKKGLLRWHQKGLWIGNDTAWEEDFQETEKGLFHKPSSQLFNGKLFSIEENNGVLVTEYTYVNGIPHGPEIYYDEQHQEESRVNWVNGKIPIQRF